MAGITSKRAKATVEPAKDDLPELSFDGFETLSIHAGYSPDPITGSRDVPIYSSTAYCFDNSDDAAALFNLQKLGHIYTRLGNPTNGALEARIAALEGGTLGTACSSGHAAQIMAMYAIMSPGDVIVSSSRLYGGTMTQLNRSILKFGWKTEMVDIDDIDAVKKALAGPNVKGLFVESLANPGAVVADLAALADAAHAVGVPLLVDNTLATPYLCQPFKHGADIVIHSTTKFISGHGNALGGVVVDSGKFDWTQNDKFPSLTQPEPAYHGLTFSAFGPLAFAVYQHAIGLRDLGMTMSAHTAWLTLTGMETLSLRMERHCENSEKIAAFLESHEKVAWVSYPTLKSSKYKSLSEKYTKGKGGAILTFGVKGGYEAGKKLVDSVKLFSHLANLGDVRSLIIHPASTTHRQLSDEMREKAGAGNDAIRLSIGIETASDLIADLKRSLDAL